MILNAAMAEKAKGVKWERVSPTYWSSPVGYVKLEGTLWSAFAFRNQRTGIGWTEQRGGFATASAAMRWVTREAEE
jgi:hypothetical protein